MDHDYELERQGHPENFCKHLNTTARPEDETVNVYCLDCGTFLYDLLEDETPYIGEPDDRDELSMVI